MVFRKKCVLISVEKYKQFLDRVIECIKLTEKCEKNRKPVGRKQSQRKLIEKK